MPDSFWFFLFMAFVIAIGFACTFLEGRKRDETQIERDVFYKKNNPNYTEAE